MLHINETGIQLPPPPAQETYRAESPKSDRDSDSKSTGQTGLPVAPHAFPLVLSRETLQRETRSIIFA